MTTVVHPADLAREIEPIIDPATRSDISPTPGNPYKTVVKTDVPGVYDPYFPRSFEVFNRTIQRERKRNRYPEYLIDEAEITLMGLHADRCQQNFEASCEQSKLFPPGTLDPKTQRLVDKVNFGQATPEEVFELKAKNVGWRAIEALKYSHAFLNGQNRVVRRAMRAIRNDLTRSGGLPRGTDTSRVGEARFSYHRPILHEGEIKAFTAVRKLNLAAVAGGMVVCRSTYIVDLTQDLPEGMKDVAKHFDHKEAASLDISRELRAKAAFLYIENLPVKMHRYRQELSLGPHFPDYDQVSQSLAEASTVLSVGVQRGEPWIHQMATSVYVRDMAKDPAERRHDGSERRYFPSIQGQCALKLVA